MKEEIRKFITIKKTHRIVLFWCSKNRINIFKQKVSNNEKSNQLCTF